MFLDLNLTELFEKYLLLCIAVGADADLVRRTSKALLFRYEDKSRKMNAEQEELSWRLEKRWYTSLEFGTPAYDVYADDLYLAELWACWKLYSRKYLKEICSEKSMAGRSILEDLTDLLHKQRCVQSTVTDLGCGMGFTTAYLNKLLPDTVVAGTNLPGLKQTRIAEKLAHSQGFRIVSDVEQVFFTDGLLFASEYFEHFKNPIKHLNLVVKTLCPAAMLIANAFGSRSTGHFEKYLLPSAGLMQLEIDGAKMSRMFNERVKSLGYVKVETQLWNNRPAYWRRV